MNLTKLFEAQALLDADIVKRHPVQDGEDRLSKKILALLVELGECANEWREFKFWSNDQKPRTIIFTWIDGNGNVCRSYERPSGVTNALGVRNPLLEEYVDCLHFILSIGNDIDALSYGALESLFVFDSLSHRPVSFLLKKLFLETSLMLDADNSSKHESYPYIMQWFLELGHKLGFTWEQIEQAYFVKNKVNFNRQVNGY